MASIADGSTLEVGGGGMVAVPHRNQAEVVRLLAEYQRRGPDAGESEGPGAEGGSTQA